MTWNVVIRRIEDNWTTRFNAKDAVKICGIVQLALDGTDYTAEVQEAYEE